MSCPDLPSAPSEDYDGVAHAGLCGQKPLIVHTTTNATSVNHDIGRFHEPPELEKFRSAFNRACRSDQTVRLKAARGVKHGFLHWPASIPVFRVKRPLVPLRRPREKLKTPIMPNLEVGIASPQVAATAQSNHQYPQTSEIAPRHPCVTRRKFSPDPRRRNVPAWRPRMRRARAP